jgi:hypothetical protein
MPVKSALLTLLLLLTFSSRAQAPTPVDMANEPHHHLLIENSHVRVFRFGLPAGESTLLHAHNKPYVAVSIGAADFANDVAGKPEVRGKTVDGQVSYSRGGFAHVARADAGIPFNNITIELLHPQGEPRNLFQKVVDAPLHCPSEACNQPAAAPGAEMKIKPLFETDDVLVTSFAFPAKESYSEPGVQHARLLVVGEGSALQVQMAGNAQKTKGAAKTLHAGEVLWVNAGENLAIVTPGENENRVTHFCILSFKDNSAKP